MSTNDETVRLCEDEVLWRKLKIKQRRLCLGPGAGSGQRPNEHAIAAMIARIEENSEHAIALFQSRDRNLNYALITFAAVAVFVESKIVTYGAGLLAALGGIVMASFFWWESRLHKYQHERRIVAARQFEELAGAVDDPTKPCHLVASVGLKSRLPAREWFSPRRLFLLLLCVLTVAIPFVFSAFARTGAH